MEEQYRTLFPTASDALSNYTSLTPLTASDTTSLHATSLQTAKPLLGPVARLHAHSLVVLKLLPVPAQPSHASFRAADRAHRALREAAVMRALGSRSTFTVPLLSSFLAPLSAVVPASKRAASSSELVLALVLPFHQRGSLADELNRRLEAGAGAFSEEELVPVVRDVAKALQYAHARGIVHRDVKAENVLVAEDGRMLLADWGLATFLRDPNDEGGEERDDTLCGTPLYLSPETTTRLRTGPAADVWALGCLCVLLLTGTPAFASSENSDDMQSLLDRIAVGDWEEARSRLNVSRSCRELLESMLTMEVEQRIDAKGILEHAFLKLNSEQAKSNSSRSHRSASVDAYKRRGSAKASLEADAAAASSAEEELEGAVDVESPSARVRKVAGTLPLRQPSAAPSAASRKSAASATSSLGKAPEASSTPWARLRAQTPSARTASDPSATRSRTRSRSRSRTRSAGKSGTQSVSLRSALENLSPEMFISSMQGASAAQESPSQRASRQRTDVRRTPFGVLQMRSGADERSEVEEEEEEEEPLQPKAAREASAEVEQLGKSGSSSKPRDKGKARAVSTEPPLSASAPAPSHDITSSIWPPYGTLGLPLVRQRSSRGRLEICADGSLLLDVALPQQSHTSPSNLRLRISSDGTLIGALGSTSSPFPLPKLEHAPSALPLELADLYAHAARWLTRIRTRSPLAAFLISPPSAQASELGRATCTVMCNAPRPDYQVRWSLYGRGTERAFSGELIVHVARDAGAVSVTRETADEEGRAVERNKLPPQPDEPHEGAKARHVLPLLRQHGKGEGEEAEIDWRTPIVRNLAPVEHAALQLALGCTATVQHVMEGALDRRA